MRKSWSAFPFGGRRGGRSYREHDRFITCDVALWSRPWRRDGRRRPSLLTSGLLVYITSTPSDRATYALSLFLSLSHRPRYLLICPKTFSSMIFFTDHLERSMCPNPNPFPRCYCCPTVMEYISSSLLDGCRWEGDSKIRPNYNERPPPPVTFTDRRLSTKRYLRTLSLRPRILTVPPAPLSCIATASKKQNISTGSKE